MSKKNATWLAGNISLRGKVLLRMWHMIYSDFASKIDQQDSYPAENCRKAKK